MNAPSSTTAENLQASGELEKRGRLPGWLRNILGIAGVYVLITILLLLAETRLAFPGWTLPKTVEPVPTGMEELNVQSREGHFIYGRWLARPGWTPARGALIYIYGNGENVSVNTRTMTRWAEELRVGVLCFDYPGYGHSTGSPNEKNCNAAALAAFDWLVREKQVAAKDIIVVGQSMGGGIATELVSNRPCRMLLTSGTFTSFPDIAQYRFFWIPARYLVRLQFDNIGKMKTLRTPIFITHGTDDHVIPFSHGERLAEAANSPKRFYVADGLRHSQPRTPEFFEAVREFLRETQSVNSVR